eukprot:1220654-Prymnesium_polylepis.1
MGASRTELGWVRAVQRWAGSALCRRGPGARRTWIIWRSRRRSMTCSACDLASSSYDGSRSSTSSRMGTSPHDAASST